MLSVHLHLFVFFHCIFPPERHVLSRNTCQTLRVFPVRTSYPACCYRIVSTTPYRQTQPPLFSFILSFVAPITPLPCPSILTYVPLYLLIYDLISTQRTHSGVWKTLCSHSMEPLSSIKPTQFTPLSLSSIFNLYSNLRAAQRKGDLRFTSHKSPQIFRLFYQQMVWPLLRTTSLRPRSLGIFTLAAREEILSWRLSHSRSSPINYTVVNPIGTELCQTRTLLIKGAWKGGLRFCFFLHNRCLFWNWRQGQSVVLLNTCIRRVKRSIRGQALLCWWHFYLRSGE